MIRKAIILILSVAVPAVMLATVLKTGAGPETAVPAAASVGTGFTYQGYLESSSNPVNSVANGIYGVTISGGGDSYSANQIGASYAVIGGGYGNVANGESSAIGGGMGNIIPIM